MADTLAPKPAPQQRSWSWRSRAFRGVVYQFVAVCVDRARRVVPGVEHARQHAASRGIQSGFDFLIQPAGFDIGEA